MNLLLWVTIISYVIAIAIVLYRIVIVAQGKITIDHKPKKRFFRLLTQVADILAYNLVVFIQEFIWHSYIYLVKLLRFILRLIRRSLHRIEKWFTLAMEKADARRSRHK
ncbi:MAG: hypothetical protein WDZ73_00085 [Candidatus Paceibacterota bacterium]